LGLFHALSEHEQAVLIHHLEQHPGADCYSQGANDGTARLATAALARATLGADRARDYCPASAATARERNYAANAKNTKAKTASQAKFLTTFIEMTGGPSAAAGDSPQGALSLAFAARTEVSEWVGGSWGAPAAGGGGGPPACPHPAALSNASAPQPTHHNPTPSSYSSYSPYSPYSPYSTPVFKRPTSLPFTKMLQPGGTSPHWSLVGCMRWNKLIPMFDEEEDEEEEDDDDDFDDKEDEEEEEDHDDDNSEYDSSPTRRPRSAPARKSGKGKATAAARRAPGDEVPGDGFNIPKAHDFLNFTRVIREIGFAKNACTSSFERQNKNIKSADRLVRRDNLRGRHAEEILIVATRLDLQKSSADSADGGSDGNPQQKRDSIGISFLDPSDVRIRAALGVAAAAPVRIAAGCLLRCSSKSSVLRPGHSCRLLTGIYVLVEALVVERGGEVKLVCRFFTSASSATASGRHPEIPLRYFKLEDAVRVVQLCPEHIVSIASSVAGEGQYLLNSGLFYYEEKVRRDTDVFSSCPRPGCRGQVACPRSLESKVTCGFCHLQFTWM
jgi:hypothetical protein